MGSYTITLHRVLRTSPERVWRAFLDPDALAKWMPPHGFTAKVHQYEGREGGRYKMSFTNFGTQESHSFGGEYKQLVPHERIHYVDSFDDPNLPGTMDVTVTLRKVSSGTELKIVQAGIPDVIPEDACHVGWNESLMQLALLVEPDVQG